MHKFTYFLIIKTLNYKANIIFLYYNFNIISSIIDIIIKVSFLKLLNIYIYLFYFYYILYNNVIYINIKSIRF